MLGAGALQTVGLKTITAKHLMLVAQCLQVVILNMNTIKNHFELRLTPKQYVMLSQFDQILRVSFIVFPHNLLYSMPGIKRNDASSSKTSIYATNI